MVTPEDLLNSRSDRKCKTCVRLVKMFRKRKILKMVVAMMMMVVSVVSCVKDDEPVNTTIRKVYPVEGRYTGSFFMDNDSLNLHWKFNNRMIICAVNGEELLIETMRSTAKAWTGASGYNYETFWIHGQTACGQTYVAEMRGTGVVTDGSIDEKGWFKMVLAGKFIPGNWRSVMEMEK